MDASLRRMARDSGTFQKFTGLRVGMLDLLLVCSSYCGLERLETNRLETRIPRFGDIDSDTQVPKFIGENEPMRVRKLGSFRDRLLELLLRKALTASSTLPSLASAFVI
jgi:hypothetical protein